jgi:hypothetical protein
MAIQITYDGGVYEIKGLLNSQNSVYLENHLNTYGRFEWYCSSLEKAIDQQY